jgi:hypothetical protein
MPIPQSPPAHHWWSQSSTLSTLRMPPSWLTRWADELLCDLHPAVYCPPPARYKQRIAYHLWHCKTQSINLIILWMHHIWSTWRWGVRQCLGAICSRKGLVIWHGNESTHLCGLLVLLNTLSFPMKNRFFVPQPRMYLGTRGIFSLWKFTCLKTIMERVTDHTSWLDATSPLSACRIFASCHAQCPLSLFVS